MAKLDQDQATGRTTPMEHGAALLPGVSVDSYNLRIRDSNGFLGDRASKSALQDKVEEWRKRYRKDGRDPLGDDPTEDMSKKDINAFIEGDDMEAAALVLAAADDFSAELAHVLRRFLKEKSWKNTERIVVGGGTKQSIMGQLAIARAMGRLHADGVKLQLRPIVHHPDEAGLIGAAHLMPAWMLEGHEAMIGVDIGGTNIRAGIVETRLKKAPDLSKARVTSAEHWKHAEDDPSRKTAVERLVDMIKSLLAKAKREKLDVAPLIGIACPGEIEPDGSIRTGGQNLPGGNWESEAFNLPREIMKGIPRIAGHDTFIIMHNDAVVQGLSQSPFMRDVKRWGVLTIGTGLGNARFTNRPEN
ncbi:ROK family protein [Phyllobacterium sp. 21LDTY02-6]|uniref:ROK family protein n=1 Tax=Phyllobacterium sp. 21LDTY02-6 TaxID=2944903 RepID=UPI0020207D85|nr:ROK family protein [Phyllobacterium sp. 21LDTY02-6]MCO4319712.1 ROK family protein [Phyllobacterium sp. 21LDTY02-6]